MKKQTKKLTTAKAIRKAAAASPRTVALPIVPAKPTALSAKAKAAEVTLASLADSWKAQTAEMDRLIAVDPNKALHVAQKRFDYSLELLCRLIEKKALFEPIYRKDGTIDDHFSHDTASVCLTSRLWWIKERVAKYALAGDPDMIYTAWSMSRTFAETIHDVALERPDRLEWLTKGALFMPSLRAKPKTFRYDFPTIAEKTHLSEECLFDTRSKACHQLDKPPTRLVADILQDMAYTISSLKHHKRSHALFRQHAAKGHAQFQQYADTPLEKWLVESNYIQPYQLHYDELPQLTKSAVPVWWEKAIKGEVVRRFDKVKGTRFYAVLRAATESGKDYEVRDELKRRCRQALRGLAHPDPKTMVVTPPVA